MPDDAKRSDRNLGDKAREGYELLRTEQGRADLRFLVSRRWLNPLLQPLGFVVTADHFYQPLLTDRHYREIGRPFRMPSAYAAHASENAALLEEILSTHAAEFFGPDGPAQRFGYTAERSQLGPGDQEVLFSMIRAGKPRRVIEVGAGGSTLIIAAALALNDDGASFVSVEPYPTEWLSALLSGVRAAVDLQVIDTPFQDTDPALVQSLGAGDVLFIDSSHVYRPGSDVEFQFLEVYPRLASGVLLHIHDIHLPVDYPPAWNLRGRRYWNEQYVLEAVLANSQRFRPALPLASLGRTNREIFERHLPGFTPDIEPGSVWFEIAG